MTKTCITTILAMLLWLSGCVGVIESGTPDDSATTKAKSPAIFNGVYDGFASAHNKIVVRFQPATGGSGVFSYLAYLDGNFTKPHSTLLGTKATTDIDGMINMEITKLQYNTSYMVTIYVQDINTQKVVNSTKSISVWTMSDFVPEFNGINQIETVSGVDAINSLLIKWNTAATPSISGDDAFNPIHTPSGYNIYYSTKRAELEEVLKLPEQHSPVLTPFPNTKIINVPSTSTNEKIVTSLVAGQEYFFAVRSRQSSTPPIYERNIKILSASTLEETPVIFNGIKTATIPNDIKGFSQITVSWESCIACSEYRVYVKPSNLDTGSINPTTDATYLATTITNFSINQTNITNGNLITANQTYNVYMLACKDSACGWDGSVFNNLEVQGRNTSKSVTTTPPIAPFSQTQPEDMITSITQPSGINGLKQLKINWSSLDTSLGYYSKVRVYRVLNKLGNVTSITGNANLVQLGTSASLPFGTPYLDPGTPTLESSANPTYAVVTNLNRDTEYCFLVLPWITGFGLTSAQEITLPASKWPEVKCGTASYLAPNFGISSLFPMCTPQSGGSTALLEWTPPEQMNIFTHYEIFYRKSSDGAFTFSGAGGAWLNGDGTYLQDSDYPKVDYLSTSLNIHDLIPNTEYHFGINTYYLPQGEITPFREYPIGQSTATCQTQNASVLHNGWKHVEAIGPKINGVTYAIVPEKLREDKHRVASPDFVNGSTTGIVRVQWYDFEIAGSSVGVNDFDLPGNSGIGFHVYRFTVENDTDKADMLDVDNPKWSNSLFTTQLKFNLVENSNGKFAYSSDSINADINSKYLIPASYFQTISGDPIYEFVDYPPAKSKIYYYKVVPVFNNIEATFEEPANPANILMVIVPNNNEAFIHRWIANLSLCEKMGRGIKSNCTDLLGRCSDIENNFRCVYEGIGGVTDTGVRYLDRGKHIVMDRFENGTNYTRGKCTIGGVDNLDCFNPNGAMATITHSPAFVNDAIVATASGDTRPQTKNNSADVWRLPNAALNYFVPASGVAKNFFTNNAYMPTAHSDFASTFHFACTARDVQEFYPGDGMSSTKRILRHRDFVVAGQLEEKLTPAERTGVATAANTIAHTNHQDCNSNYQAMWNHANYNANFASKVTCVNPGIHCLMKGGTDGEYSTENCQSRFGVQDLIGNGWEHSSDMIDRTTGIGMTSTIDPTNSDLSEIRFDAATVEGTVTASINISAGAYVNRIFYIPLTCAGASGYNPNPTMLGFHQCGPDDKLAKDLNVLLTSDYYGFKVAGMPHAKHRAGFYGGGWTAGAATSGELYMSFGATFDGTANSYAFRCVYDVTD